MSVRMNDPDHWLTQEKKARLRADFCLHDPRLKELLLEIADDYLWLATFAESRRKRRPWVPQRKGIGERADATVR